MRQHDKLNAQQGSTFACLLLWLAGLAAILYVCVINHWPSIEQKMSGSVGAAVQSAGAINPDIIMDGRNVLIQGVVDSQDIKEAATQAALGVTGIRSVDNRQTIKPVVKPDIESLPSSLAITSNEGTMTLTGRVPSQDLSELLTSGVQQAFPNQTIVNRVAIDSNTESPNWIEQSIQGLSVLQGTTNPSLMVNGQSVTVSGEVDSEESKSQVADELSLLFDQDIELVNQLQVITPPALIKPELSINRDNNSLNVSGILKSGDQADSIITSLESAFPDISIENNITRSPDAADALWLEPVLTMLPALDELGELNLTVNDSGASLTGVAANEDDKTGYEVALRDTIGSLLPIEASLSVEAAPEPEPQTTAEPTPVDEPAQEETSPEERETTTVDTQAVEQPVDRDDMAERLNNIDTSSIRFESGSAILTAESQQILDAMAAVLNDYPARGVNILGHTDSRGNESKNLLLSEERSEAVKRYLIDAGISETRLQAFGFGDSAPIADNDTVEGRARNRRIEFNY